VNSDWLDWYSAADANSLMNSFSPFIHVEPMSIHSPCCIRCEFNSELHFLTFPSALDGYSVLNSLFRLLPLQQIALHFWVSIFLFQLVLFSYEFYFHSFPVQPMIIWEWVAFSHFCYFSRCSSLLNSSFPLPADVIQLWITFSDFSHFCYFSRCSSLLSFNFPLPADDYLVTSCIFPLLLFQPMLFTSEFQFSSSSRWLFSNEFIFPLLLFQSILFTS
jgi:hypothetical protein